MIYLLPLKSGLLERVKPKENLKTKNSGLGLITALSLSKLVACDIGCGSSRCFGTKKHWLVDSALQQANPLSTSGNTFRKLPGPVRR